MTVKEFLETFCEDEVQVEISDSWYEDEETFCMNDFVKNVLASDGVILNMKVKSIDSDMYQLLILVEK